ncbi:MAG: branched-chain amino acid transport system ATP-binding protein [Puniceicoccaceae bacterium 5H]|nr:MAG: branched-chain amino acid transport system ATP-binding protein [Puniceicoccaceae bacterium 5H]
MTATTLPEPTAKTDAAPRETVLTVKGLCASYDHSLILRQVDLDVRQGEIHCLMGRNGVGKTTTLKSIMGIVEADSGDIQLRGKRLKGLSPEKRARLGIGYVPQGRDIFSSLTVRENLQVPVVVYGRKARDQMDRVLELFPVLKEMLHRKGGVLSGGQQQQLALARALLTDPKLLILDEPTEGIQPSIIDLIEDTLKLLREEGRMGILLVEQSLDFAQAVGDRFSIMNRGSIAAHGAMASLGQDLIEKHLTV